jgi:hypothetical protein
MEFSIATSTSGTTAAIAKFTTAPPSAAWHITRTSHFTYNKITSRQRKANSGEAFYLTQPLTQIGAQGFEKLSLLSLLP